MSLYAIKISQIYRASLEEQSVYIPKAFWDVSVYFFGGTGRVKKTPDNGRCINI
jgi:hypothetical protein